MAKSDLSSGGLIAAGLTALALFLKNYRNQVRKRREEVKNSYSEKEDEDVQNYPDPEEEENDSVKKSYDNSSQENTVESEQTEEEEAPKKPSFLEEAILQAIERGVDYTFFQPKLDDDYRSLSPSIKISRYFDRNIYKEARKVDILFPIPMSISMDKMNMGEYTTVTGEKKLPGPSPKSINQKLFWSAFNYKNGYVIDRIMRLLPCLDESYIDTDLEGYYFISYFTWDRAQNKYVRKQKIFCGVDYRKRQEIESAWEGKKNKQNEALKQYLTKVFEKFVLSGSSKKLSSDILDPLSVEKGSKKIDDIAIDYVILCHRVSIVIADDDHPTGITPYQMSLLLNYISSELEISDGLASSKKFVYERPLIYDEEAMENGRFVVYNMEFDGDGGGSSLVQEGIDEEYLAQDEADKNKTLDAETEKE